MKKYILYIMVAFILALSITSSVSAASNTLKYAVIYVSESDDTYNPNWRDVKVSFDKVSSNLYTLSNGKYSAQFDLLGEKRINDYCWNPATLGIHRSNKFGSIYTELPGSSFDINSVSMCAEGPVSVVCPHCRVEEPGKLGCSVGRTVSIINSCTNKIPSFANESGASFTAMKRRLLREFTNNPEQYADTIIIFGRFGPPVFDPNYIQRRCTSVGGVTLAYSNFAFSEYALQTNNPIIDCSKYTKFTPPKLAVQYDGNGWEIILHEILHGFGAVDVYQTGFDFGVKSFYEEALALDPKVTQSVMGDRDKSCKALSDVGTLCTLEQLDQTYLDKYNLQKMGWDSSTTTPVSTIRNVAVTTGNTPPLAYKYNTYPITWSGTNLSKVNIDLYDFKGLYKQRTIKENYSVPFSKDIQTFTYNWYVNGNDFADDIYKIRVTDALNKKVKDFSSKIDIQEYQIPVIGTAQAVGSSTAKLNLAPGGRENSLTGTFSIKVNADTDVINIPANYGFYTYAKRIVPEDKPGEYSTMYIPAVVDSATGDFTRVEDPKGGMLYKIARGKSATFKIVASFKPEQMFAGQYKVIAYDINITNSQNKRADLTFSRVTTSNSVTIVGEKSPYIISVNNPVNANSLAVIEGDRFDTKDNTLIADGKTYNLPGAKDGKISFFPERVGLTAGQYWFQIDSPNGKSNYEWLDIRPAQTGANIFTAFLSLFGHWFDF